MESTNNPPPRISLALATPLAEFLVFHAFDIWKPFPVRQPESLPEGRGILADDWFAGLYAALVLRLKRHFSGLETNFS